MKDKFSKVIFTLFLISLIIFSCIGIFALFNGLVAYKNASGNDWINFTGGIIGSLIAGIIAIITFYYTIRNNNRNQREAHELQIKLNIENNNLQASLKVQDNLTRKMETERSVLSATYNHLENFLYSVFNMLNQNDNYIEMKNDYLKLYNEVISSVNNIKFNSEIFDDRSQCENCSMCEIKTYGILIKSANDIQKEMFVIDEECRFVLGDLSVALNLADQNSRLQNERNGLEEKNNRNQMLMLVLKMQNGNNEKDSLNGINSFLQNIEKNNQRILEIDKLAKDNLLKIAEQINLAKNRAAQIDNKNKMKLYILIRKYFTNYNLYIKEVVFSVENDGKKPNIGCAKLDFEKNHGVKKL